MAEKPSGFGMGCRKDPLDRRDLKMSEILPPFRAPLEIDYTDRMSPVRDQGPEGTCVAFAAVTGIKEYQEKLKRDRLIELSPRYVYHHCKLLDGIPDREGTYPRVAMKVLAKRGVCLEECWPYRPYQTDDPCPEADEQAKLYRIKSYARLAGIAEMERSLAANGPFLAGVEVFSSWLEGRGRRTGVIPMPKSRERSLGGHAVCVVAYSEERQVMKFKNSWGTRWGDGGYGTLPFEYLEAHLLDAWSAVDL